MAGKAAFGAAPVKAVVVFQLVKRPVVQPECHGVFRAVGLGLGLCNRITHDLRHGGMGRVIDARPNVGRTQIADIVVRIHKIETDVVAAGGGEFKSEVVSVISYGFIG